MSTMQHEAKTYQLESGAPVLVMLHGHHVFIDPGKGDGAEMIFEGCGKVSNPFYVAGACDPPHANVSARLTGGPRDILGTPTPQPAYDFNFKFTGVPAGTYMLIVDGCNPPEECEVTVQ